ncbi:MAG: DNA repair protein RadA, partial [Candidatus Omnitrophica bacterium]|nr:DNA repair protein RadA [Candidatus Omnitrophota bacterium]
MKTKTLYVCQECGAQSSGWLGKCSSCQSWNSFVEERMNPVETPRDEMFFKQSPVLLSEVPTQDEYRFKTDNEEFDRVLGG